MTCTRFRSSVLSGAAGSTKFINQKKKLTPLRQPSGWQEDVHTLTNIMNNNIEITMCWTCDKKPATKSEYRDALGENEMTCADCHREEYPEQYCEEIAATAIQAAWRGLCLRASTGRWHCNKSGCNGGQAFQGETDGLLYCSPACAGWSDEDDEPEPDICCDLCDYTISQSDLDHGRGRVMERVGDQLRVCGCCRIDSDDEDDESRCPTCGEWESDCVSCECPHDCKCLKLCEEENGGRCPAQSCDDEDCECDGDSYYEFGTEMCKKCNYPHSNEYERRGVGACYSGMGRWTRDC